MATYRSLIAKQLNHGKFKFIYVHNDGDIWLAGKLLVQNYDTEEKVDKLLALGDLSWLGEKLEPDKSKPHTINNGQHDVTFSYMRDRGDTDTKPVTGSLKKMEETGFGRDCVNIYIFTHEGEWKITHPDIIRLWTNLKGILKL